ncbi:hypothetical protein [Streptomyces canus]|uniref:hypothetical protein n=1 Tax=Streptomyces canus TaxID=58343 RepID=UPI00216AFBDB|nr:hypothetical protein [Streptomyces canus]
MGEVDARPCTGCPRWAVDPGQTATDFTGGLGHSVADGAESVVTLATIGPDGPTGQFIDRSGNLPW